MMKQLVAASLCVAIAFLSVPVGAAPEGWVAAPYGEDGGLTFQATEGDAAPKVVVVSLADLSIMSIRAVPELVAEFDADPQEALEFALSVLWIDIDEAEPIALSEGGAPLLVGDGFTEFGERRFAILARGEGEDRRVIALIATDAEFDGLGGAAFLDQDWLDADLLPRSTPTQVKGPEPVAPTASAKPGQFTAPRSYNDMAAWPKGGELWQRLVPGNPASPRHLTAVITDDGAASHDAALREFVVDGGVEITGSTKLEPLEAWTNYDSRDVRILLTETRFAGGDGVLFLFLSRGKGKAHVSVFAVEMAAETYREWSSVARMLVVRGIIKSVDVYPPERLVQIVNAPLREQMALYEATLDMLYRGLVIGLIQTQSQTLMMMQELNYDLLFDNDITAPGIAD